MLTVGLTGGIAAGKSRVARELVALGAAHVDADDLAHGLTRAGGAAVDAVVAAFGAGVLGADGGVDRERLGRRVFSSPDARARLEALLHPLIRAEIGTRRAELDARGDVDVLVVEAALLVEAGQVGAYDLLLVVEAPDDVKIARLVTDRGLSFDEAATRVAAQLPAGQKLLAADIALWNDGGEAQLTERCREIWRTLMERTRRNREK